MLKIPPELKKITQYVRRAEELDKDESNPESRLVAYYCRQYAVQLGISLAATNEGKTTLAALLDALDAEKVAMGNFSKEEAYTVCLGFAMKVFDKADGEDRRGAEGGTVGKGTAKTFYVAASFLDVLKQFGEDDGRDEAAATEEEKKSFYAKWKATDILKAIKEGRAPTPGGFEASGEEEEEVKEEEREEESPLNPTISTLGSMLPPMQEELGLEQTLHEDEMLKEAATKDGQGFEVTPPPSYPGSNSRYLGQASTFDRPPMNQPSIPAVQSMPTAPKDGKSKKSSFGKMFRSRSPSPSPPKASMNSSITSNGVEITKEMMKDAKELTRFALKALDAKNVDLAVQRLKEALESLGH